MTDPRPPQAAFSSIVEHSPDGILVVGRGDRIRYANPAAARMLGTTREALILGQPHWPVTTGAVMDLSIDTGTGEARITETRWEGEPALLVTIRDVTDHRGAELALRQRDQHLERIRRMEAIALLAGGVAHEFNNLLMVIKGFTELATLHRDSPDRLSSDLNHIRTAAQRAAEITSQLLSISRRSTLPPQRVILGPLLEETRRLLDPLLGEQVALEMDLTCPEAAMMADPGEVQQVLMNLAINARDAMPGGGRLQIGLAPLVGEPLVALPAGDWIALWVTDSGEGMDDQTLARAIEPFFTTKPVGSGTGLGLSTVFGIAQGWGATLHLTSAPGEGTTATLYLPRLPAVAPIPAAPPPGRVAVSPGITVLVVEDEAAVRAFIAEALAESYRVLLADGPPAALVMLEEASVDLILADVIMPGMSGPELAAELQRRGDSTPVVYLSGYPDRKLSEHLASGTGYLQKPLSADQLIEAIEAALIG